MIRVFIIRFFSRENVWVEKILQTRGSYSYEFLLEYIYGCIDPYGDTYFIYSLYKDLPLTKAVKNDEDVRALQSGETLIPMLMLRMSPQRLVEYCYEHSNLPDISERKIVATDHNITNGGGSPTILRNLEAFSPQQRDEFYRLLSGRLGAKYDIRMVINENSRCNKIVYYDRNSLVVMWQILCQYPSLVQRLPILNDGPVELVRAFTELVNADPLRSVLHLFFNSTGYSELKIEEITDPDVEEIFRIYR